MVKVGWSLGKHERERGWKEKGKDDAMRLLIMMVMGTYGKW